MEKKIKSNIYNLTAEKLEREILSLGLKKYVVHQIEDWIYRKFVSSFSEMTNIAAPTRLLLEENFSIELPGLHDTLVSKDGTTKFIFRLKDNETIESVLIEDGDRKTLCISSQAGCAYDCKFCVTGKLGFVRSLDCAEITGQLLYLLKDGKSVTNIVFMGMGEPFANFGNVIDAIKIITDKKRLNISPRRITVSTCGITPKLLEFSALDLKVNIAVSTNSADEDKRSLIMPVNKKYPLSQLISACKKLDLPWRNKLCFEYILIKSINDSREDAGKLAKLLKGISCRINLIAYNENPYIEFRSPAKESMLEFQKILIAQGYTCFIRKSKGNDIQAACGQLKAIYNKLLQTK